MITNDRQYKIINTQIENFQEALDQYDPNSLEYKDIHPKIIEAQKDAIRYKLNVLLREVQEYKDLKEGRTVIAEVKSLSELPLVLIKARIANGFTQAELAEALGLKEQQIQKYESDKYETASLKTLLKISEILKLKLDADIQIKEIESPEIFNAKNYPFRQMFNRKWFSQFHGTLNDAVKNSSELLQQLYSRAGISEFKQAFTRMSVRSGSSLDEFALNAWYARVIIKAREQDLSVHFNKEVVTPSWLVNLANLSADRNGPAAGVKFLKDHGIRVVIEPHLEGTHLDGAALLMDDLYPVIALSLRYDRLDNFWFVLFHELAHVVLHLDSQRNMIFDDLDVKKPGIEDEADKYALNVAIPDRIWKTSLARFSPSDATIKNQARALNVHPALIAGRIRWESGEYYLYNDLIGQGEVKKSLAEGMGI